LRQRLREDPAELEQLLEHTLRRIVGGPTSAMLERVRSALERAVGKDYTWPGNVRELEQAVRRILLTGRYQGPAPAPAGDEKSQLLAGIQNETLDADGLLAGYCRLLYARSRSYEAVARRTNLDRRTVKKYLHSGAEPAAS